MSTSGPTPSGGGTGMDQHTAATWPSGDGAAGDRAADLRTPDAVVEAVQRIEASEGLDDVVAFVRRVADAVVGHGPRHDALTGTWLGHAVHPMLTDVPIGFWTSAAVLDLLGGRSSRKASRRLVAWGVLTAVPTAATGLAEWLHTDRPAQRVGVVHANANTVALLFYVASWRARRRGRHVRGVLLGLVGGAAATLGGYLGGHLTVARKVGTRDERFAEPAVSS